MFTAHLPPSSEKPPLAHTKFPECGSSFFSKKCENRTSCVRLGGILGGSGGGEGAAAILDATETKQEQDCGRDKSSLSASNSWF